MAQNVKTQTITFNIGPICEGKLFKIGNLDEYSCFHVKSGKCNSTVPYSVEDLSDNIQISGGEPEFSEIRETYKQDGIHEIKVLLYTFMATKTTEIIVTSESPIDLDIPADCPDTARSYTLKRVWIHKIQVVPKPPKPTLNLERYISPGAVNFIASGCPTDKPGYNYRWNGAFCKEDAGNNFGSGNKDGTLSAVGGVNYRVLCSEDNTSCLSEPTEFKMGLTYNPPDLTKIPPEYMEQIKKIENIQKDLSAGYHYYSVETAICDTDNNSNCTASNVFSTLTSSNQFVTPVPREVGPTGSNSSWYTNSSLAPVTSYDIVNLSGPFTGSLLEVGLESLAKRFTNPIMTYIDYANLSVINYTLSGHILFPGRVIRQVVKKCKKIYVLTIGEGKTVYDGIPSEQCLECSALAAATASINISQGERIFKNADNRVINEYKRRFP